MKKKYVVLVAIVLIFAALMCACANKSGASYDDNRYSGNDESSTAGRVVVYTYYADIYTKSIDAANTDITAIVAEYSGNYGCYIKLSEKTETYAYYTIKIKSAGFTSAVQSLAEVGDVEYERTLSVDITDYSSGGSNELSTLNIHVYLVGSNKASFNEKLWNVAGFVWTNIVGNIFAVLIMLLPFAAIAFGIIMIVFGIRRKNRKKTEAERLAAEKAALSAGGQNGGSNGIN